jgi:hypothetical protein
MQKSENREFHFAKVGTVVHEAKQKVMKQNNAKNKGNFISLLLMQKIFCEKIKANI